MSDAPGKPDLAVLALAKVRYLRGLDDRTLAEIAARASRQRYAAGDRIVAELEAGEDVFVVLEGEAEISVDCASGGREVLGKLGPGDAFGEMSSLTGELRSATVSALGDVEVLIIEDDEFDRLRERRPVVARELVRLLADRLATAEESVEALLSGAAPHDAAPHSHHRARRGSIRRAWRELVVRRERDLAFLTLAAFVVTLVAVRVVVFASFHFDIAPRSVLRMAYMTGFSLVMLSSCTSLLTFRPAVRRALALGYGVGLALILNELGVTLAFDIFFKDIHTPDPNVPFDIERLYRRAEPLRAIALGLLVLVQAVYLRRFYQRAAFVVTTRLRKLFARAS
jgi:CRP-like cAMP-binding protein